MKRLASLTLVGCALTLTAQNVSPWNGTWKLDRAKSHLTGSTYTFSKGSDGMWTESYGTLSVNFAPDGKPYPVFDQDHTMTVTMPDAHTQRMVNQQKGQTTSVATAILSADGNSIKETELDTRPDGTTYTASETDKRVGTGEGFLGTWSSEKVASTGNSPMTIVASSENITFTTPAEKYTLTAKLDGSPATPASPGTPAGLTISYKKASDSRLDWTATLNDKVVQQGYDELAANGKSFTTTAWLIGNESEKTTSFYARQ